jgi:signal transduction histidine kinase
LLSLFGETILDYTIEDITLFMTIADQIGGLVERARLLRLARQAAVIEERQRLARELHDSVTQLLYSQVLFAGAGLKVMRQNNLPLAAQHLERLNQAALQALKEMRLLVYQLHPSDTLDEGLARALERRLEAVEKRTGINIHLDIPVVNGVELNLDDAAEMALYRIAEEALNNMLKHAEASEVHVKLSAQGEWIVMEIVDNGCGFDPLSQAGRGGMGLVNMRERAAALGGTCEWISAPGMGTRVVVKIKENA